MAEIFRKSSLEKLSSPEQLDRMIVITSPTLWLSLVGAAGIIIVALLWAIFGRLPVEVDACGIYVNRAGVQTVYAANGGVISEILVTDGAEVKKGDIIALLDSGEIDAAIQGYAEITASADGIISNISVSQGSVLGPGSEVAKIRMGDASDRVVVCYIPIGSGKKIEQGMEVMVYPTTVNKDEYGHMKASVISVDDYITSIESMQKQLGDDQLVEVFLQNGPVVEVVCELERSEDTVSGYYWSSKKGASVAIDAGTIVDVSVITEEKAPITMLIPYLEETLTVKVQEEQ